MLYHCVGWGSEVTVDVEWSEESDEWLTEVGTRPEVPASEDGRYEVFGVLEYFTLEEGRMGTISCSAGCYLMLITC